MRILQFISLPLLLILLSSSSIFAIEISELDSTVVALDRADSGDIKVGLALSGGGAKGFAQIGVLKVLDEVDFPIDYVAGNSIGSIVGAFLSLGYSVDSIESIVKSIDWVTLMSDDVPRKAKPLIVKQKEERYNISLPFSKSGIEVPLGILNGQNIQNLFAKYSFGYHDDLDFDDLPIPFRCIATNALTGEEVVLDSGYIPDVIRSSMCIPGVFTPVEIDSIMLLDGMLTNNFPVDVCRDMGADIVLGIDIQQDPISRTEDITSIYSIIDNMTNWLAQDKYRANVESCDIYIRPDISKFSSGDFDKESVDSLIAVGEIEARKLLPQIIAIRDSLNLKRDRTVSVKHESHNHIVIEEIEVEGVDAITESGILSRLGFKSGDVVNLKMIEDGIDIIYGTGRFSSVKYRLLKGGTPFDRLTVSHIDQGRKLLITPNEKRSNMLNVGIHYDQLNNASLLLNTTFWDKTLLGARLSIDLKLSQYMALIVDYTSSRGAKPAFGSRYQISKDIIPIYKDGDISGEVNLTYQKLDLDAHSILWDKAYFGVGLRGRYYNTNSYYGDDNIYMNDEGDVEDALFCDYFGYLMFENLDKSAFSTSGWSVQLDYSISTDNGNPFGNNNSAIVEIRAKTVLSMSEKFTLIPAIYSRAVLGKDQGLYQKSLLGGVEQFNYLGTQIPFIGLEAKEVIGTNIVVSRLDLRYNVVGSHYLTLKSNYAMLGDDLDVNKISNSSFILGGGLTYSYDSSIGPLELTGGLTDHRSGSTVFINLGYWF